MNFATFFKDLLAIMISPAFQWQDMNMYLISLFISRPMFPLELQ
jgi:hypothetical protein